MKVYGDGGTRERRPGKWECYFSVGGKMTYRSAGTTEAEALKTLRRFQKQVAGDDFESVEERDLTIGKLLDSYVLHLERKGRRSPSNASNVKRLRKEFGLDRALDDLIDERIERWTSRLLREGYENASVNRLLQTLRAAYRLALKKRKIKRVPFFDLLEEDNTRTGFFEADQWTKVRAVLQADYGDFGHFAYLTGMRPGNIRALKWLDVDMRAKELTVGRTKNGEPLTLPLTGELLALIEKRKDRRTYKLKGKQTYIAELVFHRRGHAIGQINKAWAKACTAAKVGNRLIYDFRRTGVRNLIRAGVSEQVVMSISGHKTRSMLGRYNISSTRDKLVAFQQLDVYLAGQGSAKV